MCLGIPGEIVEVVDAENNIAEVNVAGVRRAISTKLLASEGIQAGDWVLVHVGFAMSKIDAREAELTLDQIQKLGDPWEEEMEAFQETEIL